MGRNYVTGGTRNGSGVLVVRVGAVAAESVLARLQRLVDDAQRDKAPLQRIADRISSVFVPAVLVGSAVTFLIWWLVIGNLGRPSLSGLAVLLVACPCAMGLAAPVAMMVGCGRAAAMGIFVRSGDVLERLAKVDRVVFDKTGTLTERHAEVTFVAASRGHVRGRGAVLGAVGGGGERTSHCRGHHWRPPPPVPRPPMSGPCPGSGVVGASDGHRVEVSRLVPPGLPVSLRRRRWRNGTSGARRSSWSSGTARPSGSSP